MIPKRKIPQRVESAPVVQDQESENPVSEQTQQVTQLTDQMELILLELQKIGVDEDQYEVFKNRYGNVYFSFIHEDSDIVFLWKKLNRGEYKQIAESGAMAKDMSYQEAVIRKCVLAPKVDPGFITSSDAGIIPTLFSQIMYRSGFIPEHQALMNIVEL